MEKGLDLTIAANVENLALTINSNGRAEVGLARYRPEVLDFKTLFQLRLEFFQQRKACSDAEAIIDVETNQGEVRVPTVPKQTRVAATLRQGHVLERRGELPLPNGRGLSNPIQRPTQLEAALGWAVMGDSLRHADVYLCFNVTIQEGWFHIKGMDVRPKCGTDSE